MSDEHPEAHETLQFLPEDPPIHCTASLSFATDDGKSLLKLEMTGDRYAAQRVIIGAMKSWSDERETDRIMGVIGALSDALKGLMPILVPQTPPVNWGEMPFRPPPPPPGTFRQEPAVAPPPPEGGEAP